MARDPPPGRTGGAGTDGLGTLEAEASNAEECEAHAARLHACFDFDDLEDVAPVEEVQKVESRIGLGKGCGGAPAKTGPIFFFARGLECGELVQDDFGERSAPVYLFAIGLCSDVAASLCGRYVPLCRRTSAGCSVEVRLKHDLMLSGTEATPLYIQTGPFYGGCEMPTENARLLLAWWDGVWCVFDGAHGDILAQAEHLDEASMKKPEKSTVALEDGMAPSHIAATADGEGRGADGSRGPGQARERSCGPAGDRNAGRSSTARRGPAQWFVKTTLALETEHGLRSLRTRNPPEEASGTPEPWPSPQLSRRPPRLSARVVCLPERAEGVALLTQQFEELCGHGAFCPDIQVHCAWDTRGVDVDLLRRNGWVSKDRWKEGDKLLGAALSHSELWLELAQDEGRSLGGDAGALLILEDDAVLNSARPFALMLQEALAHAPDYDVVLLGAMADESWAKECSRNSPPQWISDHFVRVHYFGGFWGYLVTARGARRALRALWGTTREPRPLAGDCDILVACACAAGGLQAALCVPHLVLHPGWFGGCQNTRCSCVDYEYVLDAKRLVEIGARRSRSSRYSQRLAFVRERAPDALPIGDVQSLIQRCREAATVGAPLRKQTLESQNQQMVKDFMRRAAARRQQ